MPFTTFGLSDPLLRGILATGFTAPTEIQSRAIPLALAGKDIIGTAQTGTGKTAAFVLPILHRLENQTEAQKKTHHCKALILTPTRELAQQIEDAINTYGRFLNPRTLAIYGGTNMQNQLKRLQRGVDIIIATPGRLLDHLQRRSVNLSHVEVLVIDEADRMFDMGFINDVKKIVAQVSKERQTMMFSATISKEVRELMSTIQKHPVLIEIGEQRSPVQSVRQHFYSAPREKKIDLLFHILDTQTMDSVLIFSRTKRGADKVSHRLEKRGIKSIAIHSDRTQAQRERALAGFKHGDYRVLVATDVAARGIDVEGISHVVNFDIPSFPEDYIHRIGRTGRASATGDAITFVARDEVNEFKKIERFTSKHYELKKYPGFDYSKAPEAAPPQTPVETHQRRPQHHGQTHGHNQSRGHAQSHSHTSSYGHGQEQRRGGGRPKNGPPRRDGYQRGGGPSFRPKTNRMERQSPPPAPVQAQKGDWKKLIVEIADKFKGKKKKFKLAKTD